MFHRLVPSQNCMTLVGVIPAVLAAYCILPPVAHVEILLPFIEYQLVPLQKSKIPPLYLKLPAVEQTAPTTPFIEYQVFELQNCKTLAVY